MPFLPTAPTHAPVRDIQRYLVAQGYDLAVDGLWGPETYAAYVDHEDRARPAAPTVAPPPAKPWYLSATLLGIVASGAALFAGRYGLELDRDELTALLLQGVELGGLVVAFVGRVRATAAIDPRPVPSRPATVRFDPARAAATGAAPGPGPGPGPGPDPDGLRAARPSGRHAASLPPATDDRLGGPAGHRGRPGNPFLDGL